jgi:Immunity protein Imm1
MVLRILVTDQKKRTREETVPDAAWDDIEATIAAMDGGAHSALMLSEKDDDTYLGISGGAGEYYVFTAREAADEWTLVGREDSVGSKLITSGGQEMSVPVRCLASLPMTLRAAKSYLERGAREPGLRWEKLA